MADEEELTTLFRVHRTLMQMLSDRKYSVDDEEIAMSRAEFIEKFATNFKRENLFIHKTNPDDNADQIYVFFPEEPKVGVKTIRNCVDRMKAGNVFRAILVAQKPLTPSAKSGIKEVSSRFRIEDFQEEELVVNIKNHVLVPKHEVLTTDEKKDLLERYNLKDAQLPRMKIYDPMARYYGLKCGQVVKITRISETAGTYVTYRCVVN